MGGTILAAQNGAVALLRAVDDGAAVRDVNVLDRKRWRQLVGGQGGDEGEQGNGEQTPGSMHVSLPHTDEPGEKP